MFLLGLIQQQNPKNLVDPRSFKTIGEIQQFFDKYIRDYFDVEDPIDNEALAYYLGEEHPYTIRFAGTDMGLMIGEEKAIQQATDRFTHAGLLSRFLNL